MVIPGPVTGAKSGNILGVDVSWWGLAQWYKFRWHGTHIDLGPVSVYNLPSKGLGAFFWRVVSIIIKPLRVWYHKRYVYSTKAQIRNMETSMNWNLYEDSDKKGDCK